jgi:hypothetical protein
MITSLNSSGDDCPRNDEKDPEVTRDYQSCLVSTCQCSLGGLLICYQSDGAISVYPGPTHIAAMKGILRYIVGTASLGLKYRKI